MVAVVNVDAENVPRITFDAKSKFITNK